MDYLSRNPRITTVALFRGRLSSDVLKMIVDNKTIRSLTLKHCAINDNDVETLSLNTTSLNLRDNELGETACDNLRGIESLVHLDLADNLADKEARDKADQANPMS
eukprot:gene19417-23251_t